MDDPFAPDAKTKENPLESQLVSMNFVLKNTQSEVIKLQKVLMRYQNRQDELEKDVTRMREELAQSRQNQRGDESFRQRFWPTITGVMFITLLLSFWLGRTFPPAPNTIPVVQATPSPEASAVEEAPEAP